VSLAAVIVALAVSLALPAFVRGQDIPGRATSAWTHADPSRSAGGVAGVAAGGAPEAGEPVEGVEEGKRVRIRRIVFEGNAALTDRELKRRIHTKTALWIFRTGAFDEDQVESDLFRLQAYYRDQGFLDAKVAYRRELSEDRLDLTIVFAIDEGARYSIENIELRGHTVFTRDELHRMMGSKVGATVKRPLIDADARTIRARYGELGYIYATARAIRVFSDTPGMVRITVEIDEGEQFRVGRVIVRGNTRTKDNVVRRALNLYPPDDLFDLTEAAEAERRLVESRVFRSARVYPIGDMPGVRDVVIDVKEAEKAGDFLFGVGVTSNSGIVGNIVLNLQNFDLYDWPQSLSELVKFRSFFGGGQRFRLELQPGTTVSRFRLDFTEPYLFDKPLRFDFSAYLFERGRDGYAERRGGASVSFGKRFQRGRLQGWSGEVALRVENVRLDDLDIFASREIREDEGSNLMTIVKGTLARDRRDNRFIPTSGDRLRIGYEQFGAFGGDHAFGKLTGGYTWYKTLRTDLLERKSVLELRAEGGVIVGNAPVFEQFYGGGTGSIRGFKFRGVGPRDGIDDNNVGGDFLVLLGGEYSFPLVGEKVRGLFFLDTAMVGSGPWRASIGTGVRFTLDVFGPVPLELDLAVPVLSGPDDEEQVFSFLIGGLF
jgi:outer membrane protein assembly factor BamA